MKNQQQDGSAPPGASEKIRILEQETLPALRRAELRAMDWKPLWGLPAAFAGGVLLLFGALFKEPKSQAE